MMTSQTFTFLDSVKTQKSRYFENKTFFQKRMHSSH